MAEKRLTHCLLSLSLLHCQGFLGCFKVLCTNTYVPFTQYLIDTHGFRTGDFHGALACRRPHGGLIHGVKDDGGLQGLVQRAERRWDCLMQKGRPKSYVRRRTRAAEGLGLGRSHGGRLG